MNYQAGYLALFGQVTDLLQRVQHNLDAGKQTMDLRDLAFYLKTAQAKAEEGVLKE